MNTEENILKIFRGLVAQKQICISEIKKCENLIREAKERLIYLGGRKDGLDESIHKYLKVVGKENEKELIINLEKENTEENQKKINKECANKFYNEVKKREDKGQCIFRYNSVDAKRIKNKDDLNFCSNKALKKSKYCRKHKE